MSFCQKCGSKLADGTKFCQTCGNPVAVVFAQSAVQNTGFDMQRSSGLHCPNCKSYNFTATTETSVRTYTRNGSVRTSTTNRNYLICTTCGTKFRNIQSLEEEISKSTKSRKTLLIMGSVLLLLFILLLLFNDVGLIALPFQIFIAFSTLVCFIAAVSATKSIKACAAELEYLKINCFN